MDEDICACVRESRRRPFHFWRKSLLEVEGFVTIEEYPRPGFYRMRIVDGRVRFHLGGMCRCYLGALRYGSLGSGGVLFGGLRSPLACSKA